MTLLVTAKNRLISKLNSEALICSAKLVEPRTSAKSRVNSTSAPPMCLLAVTWHCWQNSEVILDGPLPITRIAGAVKPSKGELQNLQRS